MAYQMSAAEEATKKRNKTPHGEEKHPALSVGQELSAGRVHASKGRAQEKRTDHRRIL